MTPNVQPIGAWVLLRMESPILYDGPGGFCQKSKGGIFIPETAAQDKLGYCWATILSKGSGKWNDKCKRREPIDIPVGSSVLVRWYLSQLHRPSAWDDQHCFVHQDDLLVLREDEVANLIVP